MQVKPVEDVFCAALPAEFTPKPGEPVRFPVHLLAYLESLAWQYVAAQYVRGRVRPSEMMASDWLVTNNADEIERFQPAHDCEECRRGNEVAVKYLRENPGAYVVLANLRYHELHP